VSKVCCILLPAPDITPMRTAISGNMVPLPETARIFFGMTISEWIPIIVSVSGIVATIIGVIVTIHRLRADIKHEKVKIAREDKAILSDVSKDHYARMLQLLRKLINAINIVAAHSKKYDFQFELDPSKCRENNLFKSFIHKDREDMSITNLAEKNRKSILNVYREICDLNKNAPVFNASIDLRISKLVEHMMQSCEIEDKRYLLDYFYEVCTAPFPEVNGLQKLSNDIELMLYSMQQ